MRKSLILAAAVALLFSCGNNTKETPLNDTTTVQVEKEPVYVEPEYEYSQFEGLSVTEKNTAFLDTINKCWAKIGELDNQIFESIDALIKQLEFNNGDLKTIKYLSGLRNDVASNIYTLDILRQGMENYDIYRENLDYLIAETKGAIDQTPSMVNQHQPYYEKLEFEIDSVLNTPRATIELTRPYDMQAVQYNKFLDENKKELIKLGLNVPEKYPLFCETCTLYDHLVSLGIINPTYDEEELFIEESIQ